MELSLQTFRRSAVQHLRDEELDKARVVVAAIVGVVSTDPAESRFIREALSDLFTADADRITALLRSSYDRALRIEQRRRNENTPTRPRFF